MRILTGLCLILLGICSYTDIRKREVSLSFILLFSALALIFRGAKGIWWSGWFELMLCFLPGLLLLGIRLIKRQWVGTGDGLMVIACGYALGAEAVMVMTLSAFLISGLFGLFLLLFRKRSGADTIPFAPFLLAGCIVTALWQAFPGMLRL